MTGKCSQCSKNTIDLLVCKTCDQEVCSECWEETHENRSCVSTIQIELSDNEISILRNCTTKLGTNNRLCVSLQLKIANAILDGSRAPKENSCV